MDIAIRLLNINNS